MNQFLTTIQVILPVLFPVVCGLVLLFSQKKINSKKLRNQCVFAVMIIQLVLVVLAWQGKNQEVIFWNLTKDIPVTKIWNDNFNQDGKGPESIELELIGTIEKDGKPEVVVKEPLTLSGGNDAESWNGVFEKGRN